MDVKREWITSEAIREQDSKLQVMQVYVWIYTSDSKIVIVSKDNKNWQFPGGHPEANETLSQTALREVDEEVGLNISEHADKLHMFGYYIIEETDEQSSKKYIQTRFTIDLPFDSKELNLRTNEKETEVEAIEFIKVISIDEAKVLIPWLNKAGEYQAFINNL